MDSDVDLRLMAKCRKSLLPFFHSDCLPQVLKYVVLIISKNTPNDEKKEEFVKTTHLRVDKAIQNKQPFLLKKEI